MRLPQHPGDPNSIRRSKVWRDQAQFARAGQLSSSHKAAARLQVRAVVAPGAILPYRLDRSRRGSADIQSLAVCVPAQNLSGTGCRDSDDVELLVQPPSDIQLQPEELMDQGVRALRIELFDRRHHELEHKCWIGELCISLSGSHDPGRPDGYWIWHHL